MVRLSDGKAWVFLYQGTFVPFDVRQFHAVHGSIIPDIGKSLFLLEIGQSSAYKMA